MRFRVENKDDKKTIKNDKKRKKKNDKQTIKKRKKNDKKTIKKRKKTRGFLRFWDFSNFVQKRKKKADKNRKQT